MTSPAESAMRVLVCGGRDYSDAAFVAVVLGQWLSAHRDLVIGCGYDPNSPRFQGADQLAYEWAAEHDVPRHAYAADWGKYGRAAGPIRNIRQLAEFEPRHVVSFPGGRGTADMCERARARGVFVAYYGPGARETARLAP